MIAVGAVLIAAISDSQADNAQYFWSLGLAAAVGRLLPAICFTAAPDLLYAVPDQPLPAALSRAVWSGAALCAASSLAAGVLCAADRFCRPVRAPPAAGPGQLSLEKLASGPVPACCGRRTCCLSASGWVLLALVGFGSAAIGPFISVASGFLQVRHRRT